MVYVVCVVIGDDGPCVPVTQTTASTCHQSGTEALIDSCCRLWRPCWTTTHDDDDDHTLRRLPICYSQTQVCLNPYHWSVDITSPTSTNTRTSTTACRLLRCNKNLAIANRSRVSCAYNTSRTSIVTPWRWNVVKGHSRSLKLVPFESLGVVSYSSSALTMALSCIVCEIYRLIGQK